MVLPIDASRAADEISLSSVIAGIVRNKRVILGTAIVVAIISIAYAATRPVTYASNTIFMPQAQKQSSAVAGLAAQFGLNLSMNQGGMSAQGYADLVESREILLPVAERTYTVRTQRGVDTVPLINLYAPGTGPRPARRDATIGVLMKQVRATVSKTASVDLSVSSPYPDLSQQLASAILAEVDSFNLRNRQAEATPEREFVEQRVAVAENELHEAESKLEAFAEANRQIGTSPSLQLEKDRLARAVSMRQQVYTALAQSYEQARIDEIRNMPTIIVLERPEVPYAPKPKRIVAFGLLGLIFGAILGLMLAFLRDTWDHIHEVATDSGRAARGM